MQVVWPATRTGRLYHRDIPRTHFCYKVSRPQGQYSAGKIKLVKYLNDPIMHRNCE